jgi:hypothetical protein
MLVVVRTGTLITATNTRHEDDAEAAVDMTKLKGRSVLNREH